MLDLKKYNEQDPLKRMVERDLGTEELSPMEPPEISNLTELPTHFENYHNCLKQLVHEHQDFSEKLLDFEKAIIFFKENGLQKKTGIKDSINNFFAYMDNSVIPHNRKEEKTLFHLLSERLKTNNIQSENENESSATAVDIVEDDHSQLIQLSALAFNLLGLATRLPDQNSRLIVLDIAMEQSMALIEMLRLVIYREDHIVFDLAHQHLSEDELSEIADQMSKLG